MKNNFGFGKFEVLTVIVLLLGIAAFYMYSILGGVNDKKINKMKSQAVSLNKAVYSNLDEYRNSSLVYLEEILDHHIIDNIKSPFSDNSCDLDESKVETVGTSVRYVTLKCDNYLIMHQKATDFKNVTVYEVSDWSLTKPEGEEYDEAVLYNCQKEDGSFIFSEYREEGSFLYGYYKKFGRSFFTMQHVPNDVCNVVSNTFYRTRKDVNKK